MPMKSDQKIHTEIVQKLKRAGKRKTLFRIPNEGNRGDWRTILAPYSPEVAKFIRDKYPTAIIANEDYEAAAQDWGGVYYDPTV